MKSVCAKCGHTFEQHDVESPSSSCDQCVCEGFIYLGSPVTDPRRRVVSMDVQCYTCPHQIGQHDNETGCLIEGCPCARFRKDLIAKCSADDFQDSRSFETGTYVEFDPVKIPAHYNSGKIEVANFIADQGLEYNDGNVIKYVVRAGKKDPDKRLQDIEKAAAYLQMVYNVAQGLPAVIRDPETKEVVWTLFKN